VTAIHEFSLAADNFSTKHPGLEIPEPTGTTALLEPIEPVARLDLKLEFPLLF
jgi:hypothetical protein